MSTSDIYIISGKKKECKYPNAKKNLAISPLIGLDDVRGV